MNRKLKFYLMFCVAGILFLIGSSPAFANLYYFDNITNSASPNVASQLSVDVASYNTNQVLFTFNNAANGTESSISEIYFDDGSLLGIASLIQDTSKVLFEKGTANPPDLPGGKNVDPPFEVTAGFLSQAEPSPVSNGINPNESLGILFDLQPGQGYSDVLDDLQTGELRIGLHVISINGMSENSDSFINTVPIPATVWIFGAGLIGLVGIRRKLRS